MGQNTRDINFYWDYFFKNDNDNQEVSQVQFLQKLPFFKSLSVRQLRKIGNYLHFREFTENEYLFEYGNPGAALFLIYTGEVAIEVPTKNGLKTVAILEEHSFLGELALLSASERTASARTTKKTKCFAFFRNDLVRLGEAYPEIGTEIYKALAIVVGKRLEATTKKITAIKSTKPQETKNAA